MALRAIAGENATLSVATDAELSAIDTGFLVDGDYVWSGETGAYFYRPNSTATVSSTVIATLGSNGGTLAGRFLFSGIGTGVGPIIQAANDFISADTSITGVGFTGILSVPITTVTNNELVDISFTVAGHASAATPVTLVARLVLDGTPLAVNGGTSATSSSVAAEASAAIRILTQIPLAGSHSVLVQAATTGAVDTFVIPASTSPNQAHASLVVLKLGAPSP